MALSIVRTRAATLGLRRFRTSASQLARIFAADGLEDVGVKIFEASVRAVRGVILH